MSSEDERITELLFALQRDFKISKDLVNTLSKIGPNVIPHLVKAYTINDFAFKTRIIDVFGKMDTIGLRGLVDLLDVSELRMKSTILKTIRKMEKQAEANEFLIKKMEEVLGWNSLKYLNTEDLTDQIDDLLAYKDNLVKILLESKKNTNNVERIEEIAFITFHIYLRKIQNKKIIDEMGDIYSELKENKIITIIELEEIYKVMFEQDTHLSEIFKDYAQNLIKDPTKINNLLTLIKNNFSRWVINHGCERNFYLLNYDNKQVKNYASHSFYLRTLDAFSRLIQSVDNIGDVEPDKLKETIAELQRDYDEELEDIQLGDIIGITGENKTIQKGIKDLDLSSQQIPEIDLGPLANCKNLEFVSLKDNQLKQIDISGLRKCEKLQFLDISENDLPFIDLYPLKGINNLQYLILSKNQISTINLTPLEELVNLIELKLDNNKLTTLDLKPIANYTQLVEIDISNNDIDLIDVTPLEKCEKLEFFGVDDTTKLLWRKSDLPKEEDLPIGLQEFYSRLTIIM